MPIIEWALPGSRRVRNAFADTSIVAAGAEYLAPDDATWVQRTYDRLRLHRPGRHDVTWLPSGNLAIRADVFQRIGGFDESLETCEDVDLCRRLVVTGRLVADEALASVHYGDPRTLRAVYAGEKWRGRDNLRVTLRPPMNLRSALSALQPLVTVAVLVAAAFLMLVDWRHTLQYADGGRRLRRPRVTAAGAADVRARQAALAISAGAVSGRGNGLRPRQSGGNRRTRHACYSSDGCRGTLIVNRPIRVLELRSVRGTGGGPEKTILLGAARADPARIRSRSVTSGMPATGCSPSVSVHERSASTMSNR